MVVESNEVDEVVTTDRTPADQDKAGIDEGRPQSYMKSVLEAIHRRHLAFVA